MTEFLQGGPNPFSVPVIDGVFNPHYAWHANGANEPWMDSEWGDRPDNTIQEGFGVITSEYDEDPDERYYRNFEHPLFWRGRGWTNATGPEYSRVPDYIFDLNYFDADPSDENHETENTEGQDTEEEQNTGEEQNI